MTRRIFLSIIFAALCLCDSVSAQDWKGVHDGVQYARVRKQISGLDVNIDLLRLDPRKVRLDVHHAMDAAIGFEKTSSIAKRHGAVAAINAGFFRLDTSIFAGDATGILKIDGKILSTSHANRVALLIRNDRDRSDLDIGDIDVVGSLTMGKYVVKGIGLNSERKKDEVVIYTPEFGRTTLTDSEGLEITVRSGKVAAINDNRGSSPIPADGFVISMSGSRRAEILKHAKEGARASYQFDQPAYSASLMANTGDHLPNFARAEDVVGGVVELVRNGRSHVDASWPGEATNKAFVETRHPRTAFAKLRDGSLLMITVDGRTELSGGIGLRDLADYLLSLGAVQALNLDGGGSTTMYLDGKIMNQPSDQSGERRVSDAILVTLQAPK